MWHVYRFNDRWRLKHRRLSRRHAVTGDGFEIVLVVESGFHADLFEKEFSPTSLKT